MTRQRLTWSRAVIVMMAALLGGLTAAGLVRLAAGPPPPARSSGLPGDVVEPARESDPREDAGTNAVGKPQRNRTAPPRLLTVPRLELRLPVVPRGVDRDGAMALPGTVGAVAWYRFGSAPFSERGATVLAGHVDTAREGVGPLAGLAQLEVGDPILVTVRGRVVTYAVTSVTRIEKAVLDLPAVFSRVGRPRLHLVTCGGVYDASRGGYQDNVVVAARRT